MRTIHSFLPRIVAPTITPQNPLRPLGSQCRPSAGQNNASSRMMHELTITPGGHLLLRESLLETSDRKPSKELLEAYSESAARGMLYSAGEEMHAALPSSFEFARTIARLYLTNLCKAAAIETG